MKTDHISFGPFSDVPAAEIRWAGFVCNTCRKPVQKWLARFVAEEGDFLMILSCPCVSAAAWACENPPQNAKDWRRIVALAKKHRCEFVSISPKAAAEFMHGQHNN